MADPVVRVLDFEGPLDLLIHLIEKNKMDIYDIPIVSITDQYISYLHSFTETDLEAASQFLVMASLLLQIKSRMLLPKTELEDEDEADPRDMLVQMLLEYRCIKAVAKQLETMKQTAARQHTRRPYFADSKLRNLHYYPVSELLLAVKLLENYPEGIEFEKAFVKSGSSGEMVASFLAVLELLRLQVVRISQSMAFAPIYIFLRTVHEPVLIGGEPDAAG